ncbi:MAG: ComF family protein [Candidatus Thiodiazotropha sp. (ex Dulcina madagascariensis)]|nr:ComF family protein [Candidatus Thiodiazotropha sp. (ex Dulcina madagascariensis)]
MKVNNWIKNIRSLLYPNGCLLCSAPGDFDRQFCPACYRSLPFNRQACHRCALPLPPATPPGALCGSCLAKQPPFDSCVTALCYEPPVSRLISALKFRQQLHLVEPMAELFTDRLGEPLRKPELMLPIPLHPLRLRERGFNQSLELGRVVARRYGLAIDWRICRRVRHTQAQTGLNEKARQKNLRRAFTVCGDVNGSHLVLFDDVITTGSTIAALSKTLKRAGAKRIDVWALARTPGR